ncbi:MAG: 50S ribosomal protein L6 [Mycoplasmatales bacterium]
MSRIGNQILAIPAGVEVSVDNTNLVTVKGPKGSLSQQFNAALEVIVENNEVKVTRKSEEKEIKSVHGTTTAIIKNMILGTSEGFKKELEFNGVGYRVVVAGKKVTLAVGFSHPVDIILEEGISAEAPSNTELIISGIDKQLVGETAANIRKIRPPEPYKGKGIKYKEEVIRRKEGKRAGK